MLLTCLTNLKQWHQMQINPEYSLNGLMLKLKIQYGSYLM